MSEHLKTIVEGDGTVFHVYKQLEWEDRIDVQLQNAETGETHTIQIDKTDSNEN